MNAGKKSRIALAQQNLREALMALQSIASGGGAECADYAYSLISCALLALKRETIQRRKARAKLAGLMLGNRLRAGLIVNPMIGHEATFQILKELDEELGRLIEELSDE
jgi:hypothetical protein